METELYRVLVHEISDGLAGTGLTDQKFNGQGRVTLRNGAVYDGNWVDGSMHGMGKITFPDGIEYEGEFTANAITGSGIYRWPEWPGRLGSSTYQGQVLNGKRHGQGCMAFKDTEAIYTGDWVNGMRHGMGTLTFNRDGSHSYKGQWENDMKQGRGSMSYSNGDVYEGDFLRDLKCGHGRMSWRSSKQEYSGQWRDNAPNGIGTHIWFQQVSEKADANHALLIMYNRYHGHFVNGQRSGFGVMYYATGARFEGQWLADKKQGSGCFVFENGDSWQGYFEDDRPLLGEGEQMAPKGVNVRLYISDLVEEEEVPAASLRAINNVVMVYNSDLRTLYDLNCKRPSLHLQSGSSSITNTLLAAQFWDLLCDARLITSFTPLSKMSQLVTLARRPPEALQSFRQQMASQQPEEGDADEAQFWRALMEDNVLGGEHNPRGEVLFPAFCEALVRIAAVRYAHLPGLERRLHALITTNLLGFIAKSKLVPPPRSAMHQALWSSEAAVRLLREVQPSLAEVFLHVVSSSSSSRSSSSSSSGGGSGSPASQAGGVYDTQTSIRGVLKALGELGLLSDASTNMAAARAFCDDYLQTNMFGHTQRLTRMWGGTEGADEGAGLGSEPSETAGEDALQSLEAAPMSEAEELEVLAWLDMPVIYPEFVDGIVRLVHQAPWIAGEELEAKLQVFLADPQAGLLSAHKRLGEPAGSSS